MRKHVLLLSILVLLLRIHWSFAFVAFSRPHGGAPFFTHRQRRKRPRQQRIAYCTERTSLSLNKTTETSASDWKYHVDLNPILHFPTFLVPSKLVQSVLKDARFQPFLATTSQWNGRNKIRLVQSFNTTHQLVLRNDNHTNTDDLLLSYPTIANGPTHSLHLNASYFSIAEILSILNIPPVTAFEQIGHVVHLNLRPEHEVFQHIIGNVFLTILPNIQTVIRKNVHDGAQQSHQSSIDDIQLLAGTNNTQVTVVENGISISFDLRNNCYWNSRLAGERMYLCQDEFRNHQVIVDVFSGVGMLSLLVATQFSHVQIHANNVNPHAIAALEDAAKRHGVYHQINTSCQDAYEFLVDAGLQWKTLPHHVIVNSPLEAASCLNALRWWRAPKTKNAIVPTFHVYTLARASHSLQSAIDVVAHNLLPEGMEPTPNRTMHLNQLGCNVRAREIRDDVEPGKVVVCVSFKATAQLLRHMQGDYV